MIEKKIRTKSLEELINQPRLVKYDTYEFDELSYTCLLVDIKMLLEENKKYKEVINKAINYIDEYRDYQDVHKQVGIDKYEDVREDILFEEDIEELLEILKEVEHEKSNN